MTRRPNRNSKLALSMLSLAVMIGCDPSSQVKRVNAIVAFDVSCPTKARMLRYAQLAYSAERSLPSGSHLRIYTFGHGCYPIYEGQKILGRDAFNSKIGPSLSSPSGQLLRAGTQTDVLFERIAADARTWGQSTTVFIATDGGMEDQGPEAIKRLRSAVSALGQSHLQVLALVGVEPEFRSQWELWLRPLGVKAFDLLVLLGLSGAQYINLSAQSQDLGG